MSDTFTDDRLDIAATLALYAGLGALCFAAGILVGAIAIQDLTRGGLAIGRPVDIPSEEALDLVSQLTAVANAVGAIGAVALIGGAALDQRDIVRERLREVRSDG